MLQVGQRFAFSSIAQKTYLKFTQRYAANLEAFQKKMAGATLEAERVKKSTARAYVHPYHEPYKTAFSGMSSSFRVDS